MVNYEPIKSRKAYLINFGRSTCVEPIIDDGRPFYKRLRAMGVLFDEREDALDWVNDYIGEVK